MFSGHVSAHAEGLCPSLKEDEQQQQEKEQEANAKNCRYVHEWSISDFFASGSLLLVAIWLQNEWRVLSLTLYVTQLQIVMKCNIAETFKMGYWN